ncbi:S9 family peptidase [Candidatus Poribacteria bacterium]|nr:S9 family peptidase [Candidatus Poribacteria bacterium]
MSITFRYCLVGAVLIVAFDAVLAAGQASEESTTNIEAFLQLSGGAGEPQFSPDGKYLAYSERGSVWVRPVEEDGEPHKIGAGRKPLWRPDSNALALIRDDGSPRVWLHPLDKPDSARPISPEGVAVKDYVWSPDGKTLAVLEQPVAFGKPSALSLVDVTTGEVQGRFELDSFEDYDSLSWSPDGRYLAWDVVIEPGAEVLRSIGARTNSGLEVRLLNVKEGTIQRVLPVGTCMIKTLAWRFDGQAMVFCATPHPYGYQCQWRLATWSIPSGWSIPFGMARYLTYDPMVVGSAVWAPDGQTIYVSARQEGITQQLYVVSVQDGSLRCLTSGLANYLNPVVSPDGRWLACEVTAPDRLREIWLVATDGSRAFPLTNASQHLHEIEGLRLGTPELVRWRSVDGLELEGLLLYPPGYGPDQKPEKPLPTIVHLHGGPMHSTPPIEFNGHPLNLGGLHYLAAHGYLVFSADYRRSGYYGWHQIQRAIDDGDFVGLDASDILTGIDHLITEGLADPARLGVLGHSHGGFLANWLLTHSSHFHAVVSSEGMTNHATRPFPDSILEVWMGGKPEEVPERYRRYSPLTYAAQARTPTLLIYGERSAFTHHRQGEVFQNALAAAGVEVELVTLAGESHWISKTENQTRYLHLILEWFDRHLLNNERTKDSMQRP